MPKLDPYAARRRWPGVLALALACLLRFPLEAADSSDGWRPVLGGRTQALHIPATGKTGFTLIPGEVSGVRFTNTLSDRLASFNRILENGSGVAAGDVDGDGWCDLYLCGLERENALYRNRGDWTFQEVTAETGVACAGLYATGAVLADLDGDGDLDLLVNAVGEGTRSFLNDGRGRFTELTDTRLARRFGSTSMALGDIDSDGDLDLYVANYRTDTFKDDPPGLNVEARRVGGRIVITPEDRFIPLLPREGGVEVVERGERDFLYLNDGTGRFAPVSWTGGAFLDEDARPLAAPPTDWVLSVVCRDINQDGFPDLYTCADYFYWPDRVWLNDLGQRFIAIGRSAIRRMSVSAMSVDFADVNRDGWDDFYVTDMVSRRHLFRHRQRPEMMQGIVEQPAEDPQARPEVAHNTLFLNRGDGTYAEIAQYAGLAWTEWTWSGVFVDVDLDGYEDLLVANGNNHDVQDADVLRELKQIREVPSAERRLGYLQKFPRLQTPKLAFRNRGDLTFEESGRSWGFDQVTISQGMALADLDNDGDLDLVINNLNGEAALLRNNSPAPRLAIRLKGRVPNTHGIGARIEVRGGPVFQSQEMQAGGRYLSGDDSLRTFALGDPTNRVDVAVWWRSGRYSLLRGIAANQLLEVDEAAAGPAGRRTSPTVDPVFQDCSVRLGHVHEDPPFDDRQRQPLLPLKLSTLGPGVTWFDLDDDGDDDLIISGGKGGQMAGYRNDGRGGFTRIAEFPFSETLPRDQTTVLGWRPAPGASVLLAGFANYEDALPNGSALTQYEPADKLQGVLVPADTSSSGPLAMGDADADGDLDLFVGGRTTAGRHPEPAASRLLINDGGRLAPVPELSSALASFGLVTAVLFSDLDGDGRSELIVAGEWAPVRVFRLDGSRLLELTTALGLAGYRGWWNSLTAADVDGDGRLDLVAGNWGRNNKYAAFAADTLHLYYGDPDGNGTLDVLEAYFDRESGAIVPWRDWATVTHELAFIREAFPTCRAFGAASVDQLLGERRAAFRDLTATTLESLVFLNRGDHLEPVPLPPEAQFAPVFGIAVADVDGDGAEDIFLAQNFFGTDPDTSRYDGGRGLWLRGRGNGRFLPVPGQESGIRIYGEQRGCAVADFDADGRPDLAVAQHAGPTQLYRNARGRPGLRVRLDAGPQNPTGIGSVVRLVFADRPGPVREVHAGSGYWSQDSAVQVLGAPAAPRQLWVRWPGGRTELHAVPLGATEVRVQAGRGLRAVGPAAR